MTYIPRVWEDGELVAADAVNRIEQGLGTVDGVAADAAAVAASKVGGEDPRLSDARTPVAHEHPVSDVTGLQAELDGRAGLASDIAVRGAGASAGAITLMKSGPVVVADLAGVVLTGTSEVIATIPAGWRPAHHAGAGFVRASNGDWWPAHATPTQIMILGPAPAGTTIDGSLTWTA